VDFPKGILLPRNSPCRRRAALLCTARWGRACALAAAMLLALPAQAADKVVLQLKWQHQFQFAGIYAAQEQGYFREAGLDVTLLEGKPSSDNIQSVFKGEAQYGIGDPILLVERHRGQHPVVLATIFQHSPMVLFRSKGGMPAAPVSGTIMINPNNVELQALFDKLGTPLSSLRQLRPSYDPNDLVEGKVDNMSGFLTNMPYVLERKHFAFDVLNPRAHGIDIYGDNLFTTETELREHPLRAAAMRHAVLRGWRYAIEHPAEIVDLIRARYPQRQSREHLMFEAGQVIPLLDADIIELGYSNPGRWRA
jgi:two-component system sensor histidine kinase/response regulator